MNTGALTLKPPPGFMFAFSGSSAGSLPMAPNIAGSVSYNEITDITRAYLDGVNLTTGDLIRKRLIRRRWSPSAAASPPPALSVGVGAAIGVNQIASFLSQNPWDFHVQRRRQNRPAVQGKQHGLCHRRLGGVGRAAAPRSGGSDRQHDRLRWSTSTPPLRAGRFVERQRHWLLFAGATASG